MRTCSNFSQIKKGRKFQAIEPKPRFLEVEEKKHSENNKKEKKKIGYKRFKNFIK